MADQSVIEGQTLSLTVDLGTVASSEIQLDYNIVPDTALYSKEYNTQSGIVSIAQGQSQGVLSIPILDDNIYEPQKSFFIDVNVPNLQETRRYKINVTDDETEPQISFQSAIMNLPEENQIHSVTLILSHPSELEISVSASISGGAATVGIDYSFASTSFIFAKLQTTATKDIEIIDDILTETDEDVVLTLVNPHNASLGAPTASTITILDNELKVIATAPVNGAQWLDYVATMKGRTQLNDTPCLPLSANANMCTHGGEARTVRISDYSSCTNIKMEDVLGAFEWKCSVEDNIVYFRSRLKDGKGLIDLVEPTSWKMNRVQLINSQTSTVVRESADSIWWTNPVSVLPLNVGTAPYTLSTSGGIYTVSDARTSYGYTLSAKSAIVHLTGGSMTMSASTTTYCSGARVNVCATATSFSWIEGVFNAVSTFVNVYISRGHIHNSTVRGGGVGLIVSASSVYNSIVENCTTMCVQSPGYSFFYKLSVSKATQTGIYGTGFNDIFVDSASNNNVLSGFSLSFQSIVLNSSASNNGNVGIDINSGTIITSTAIGNTGDGVETTNSSKTLGITSALNSGAGLSEWDDFPYHHNLLLINNATGLNVSSTNTPKFSNVYAVHNTTGINLGAGTSDFLRNLYIGSNGDDCAIVGGAQGVDTNCDMNGSSTATKQPIVAANLVYGKALSDSQNANSGIIDGVGGILYASITDWFEFNNPMRIFAKQGSAFPNSNNRGRCSSGTCQLWDFSLPTSSDLKNKNGTLVNGSPCPASAYDSNSYYLLNAYEIMLNEDGNENGLCEADESCIYMPNIGSYQGSGDYSTNQCIYDNTVIQGVKMYGYPLN